MATKRKWTGIRTRPKVDESKTRDRGELDRQRQAKEMRLAGATYHDIAEALGYSHHRLAWRAVKYYLRKTTTDPEGMHRKLELERIHRVMMSFWPKVLEGDATASAQYFRWSEQLRKLQGVAIKGKAGQTPQERISLATFERSFRDMDSWLKERRRQADLQHHCPLCGQEVHGPIDDLGLPGSAL
jgi:hypothetical protein